MSREIHAGDNCSFPPFSSTLNATIAPSFTGPFSMGALNEECLAPQIGVSTQRVPLESSQLASEPQIPALAKLTSSLQISGLRYSGVRWSSPPIDLVSMRYMRHSLPA